jgi:uncharacterized protein (DUF1778 family)
MPKSKRRTRQVTATKVLKEDVVRMRVSADQKQVLADAAEREGLDLSSWLRRVALKEAGGLPEAK